MKFSKRKKDKMRKQRQRRVNRCCGNLIGCHIDYTYEVIDQATINGIMYVLAQVEDESYAIYKIIKLGQYVRLSEKRVLENKKSFSNYALWKENSQIQITDEGKIQSVEFKSRLSMHMKSTRDYQKGFMHIYIEL